MKKCFLGIILVIMFLMGCAGGAKPAQTDELDAAIRETSDYLNKQLPKGNKLVILNIQSDFPALSEYIIDELIANTVNDKVFSAVDRHQLDAIRVELDFQMSSEVDDETAQALGRMVGAQIIVSGAVSKIGDLYRLRVRALSVQTAQIEGQFNRNIPNGPTITALTQSRATGYGSGPNYGGTSGNQAAATQIPAQAAAPVTPSYKIGDTGPAGGLIFYDKGNNSGGWRYLEAAPASTEFTGIQWAASDSNELGTKTEIGEGKNNTRLIVNYSQRTGQSMAAARQCDRLEYGGYDDWFLPSRVELGLMHVNLKEEGIGGFGGGWYWSSSEGSASFNVYPGSWVRALNFGNGSWDIQGKTNKYSVRACRQF